MQAGGHFPWAARPRHVSFSLRVRGGFYITHRFSLDILTPGDICCFEAVVGHKAPLGMANAADEEP